MKRPEGDRQRKTSIQRLGLSVNGKGIVPLLFNSVIKLESCCYAQIEDLYTGTINYIEFVSIKIMKRYAILKMKVVLN